MNKNTTKTEILAENLDRLRPNDFIAIGFTILYLLVDFVGAFSSYSVAAPQWIYLAIINLLTTGYLYFDNSFLNELKLSSFLKNKISLLYPIFVFISGLSILVAYNPIESIVNYTRLFVTFTAFINLFILLHNKSKIFIYIARFLSILIIIQCLFGLDFFIKGYEKYFILDLRYYMYFNHGNKNIFAANILVKIPFLFYAIINSKNLLRYFLIFGLFIASLTLFLLGTRAITAAAIVVYFGFPIMLYYVNRKNLEKIKTSYIIYPLCFLTMYFAAFKIIENGNWDKRIITADTLSSIGLDDASLQARIFHWISAIDFIPQNPILGGGIGNWKIESMKYENPVKKTYLSGVYMHNDFLEVAAETGILNGLIYLVIFGLVLFFNFKAFLKNKSVISIVLFLAFFSYCIDSFFNFPLLRPTMQIMFVLMLLLTIFNFYKVINTNPNINNDLESDNKIILLPNKSFRYLLITLFFLGTVICYPLYLFNENSKVLGIIEKDKKNGKKIFYENIVHKFQEYPNLNENGSPMVAEQMRILLREKKHDEILKLYPLAAKFNNNSTEADDILGTMYVEQKKPDSIYKYFKKIYDLCPNHKEFHKKYLYALYLKKDTTTILNTFKKLDTSYISSDQYFHTYMYLKGSGYDFNKSYKYITAGLKKFPKDTVLLKEKELVSKNQMSGIHYISESGVKITDEKAEYQKKKEIIVNRNEFIFKAKELTDKGDFTNALQNSLKAYELDKNDMIVVENIGFSYFNLKNYEKTISFLEKVKNAKTNQTGKVEMVLAAAYYNTKNKPKACELITIAIERKCPGAEQYSTTFCN